VWTDGVRDTPVGPKVHHGDVQLRPVRHTYDMASCGATGGTSFWTPVYEVSPSCPRCGCKVSRFSEGTYSDEDPGQGETLTVLAAKLGLAWNDGYFVDAEGHRVTDEALLRYVFSTKRQAGQAFRVFSKLLENGLSLCPTRTIKAERLLPDITGIRLRDHQKEAFALLQSTGHIGDYSPPSMGKSTFGVYVLSRLAGRHVVFVPSDVLRDQWVKVLRRMTPGVRVRRMWKPSHTEVTVLDRDGLTRCVVDIFNYRTAHDFKDSSYVAAIFDESHRLPGNSAHRLVLINHEFRISMTASPYREDGRERAIQRFAGTSIGGDWRQYRDSGQIADVPVRVLVVNDLDEKFDALRSLVKHGRVLVFCEALADGRRVEKELGIPFVYGGSKRRLESVVNERVVAISKIGDCGLSLPELNRVVELSFHGGARAQSLQRYGRLLHGRDGVEHTVLMTLQELSLYAKRLTALEERGCRIRIQLYTATRGRRPETTPAGLTKGNDNPWMKLLGMAA
jgi:DNA excision repair protein ERCC-3